MTTIDTSGIRALAADLQREAPRVGRDASQALRATAARIQRTAKALAPVDTGELRDSIGIDLYGTGNSGRQVAVVGPTVEYGRIVESGFANNPPQPYMGPALEANTAGFVAALEQAAERAARRAVGQ